MLELRLCRTEDVEQAAALLVKAHAPHGVTWQQIRDYYLPGLEESLMASVTSDERPDEIVVLGIGRASGLVHAAYELPLPNMFNRDLEVRSGYIAAEPKGQGFGSGMLTIMMRIFEQVAFAIGQPLIHRPETCFRRTTRFFTMHGYGVVLEHDGGLSVTYYLERTFNPNQNQLSRDELAVVAAIAAVPLREKVKPAVPDLHVISSFQFQQHL
ncbi:hypothetical protein HYV83_02115 [Candidatus Woesearchaeota archaeon]|nr:hypothetical protein [Candidatus Woesearchaeota archaeon]